MLKYFIALISDWLIALLIVSLLVWFVIMQPVSMNVQKEQSRQVKPMMMLSQPSLGFKQQYSTETQKRLMADVNKLSIMFAPRTISYGNLNVTAHYIHQQFLALGDTEYQAYWTLNGHYSNVVLELGPDTEEIIVIGAHYDAENDSLDAEGNASGVASMLELARQLALDEESLPIRVQFVAYPLSQNQTLIRENTGSYNHAELLDKQGVNVKMMLSLDSVGRYNDDEGSQSYPFSFMRYLYPDKGNYISLIGRLEDYSQLRQTKRSFSKASSLPLFSFNNIDDFPEFISSDHENYWRNGIPAFLITDTANYRHIDNDAAELEERLNYPKMASLVEGLRQVIMDSEPNKQPQRESFPVQLVESSQKDYQKQLQ